MPCWQCGPEWETNWKTSFNAISEFLWLYRLNSRELTKSKIEVSWFSDVDLGELGNDQLPNTIPRIRPPPTPLHPPRPRPPRCTWSEMLEALILAPGLAPLQLCLQLASWPETPLEGKQEARLRQPCTACHLLLLREVCERERSQEGVTSGKESFPNLSQLIQIVPFPFLPRSWYSSPYYRRYVSYSPAPAWPSKKASVCHALASSSSSPVKRSLNQAWEKWTFPSSRNIFRTSFLLGIAQFPFLCLQFPPACDLHLATLVLGCWGRWSYASHTTFLCHEVKLHFLARPTCPLSLPRALLCPAASSRTCLPCAPAQVARGHFSLPPSPSVSFFFFGPSTSYVSVGRV